MTNEEKVKKIRIKYAKKVSENIQYLLYFIENSKDEKIICKFWKFLEKYEK